MKKVLFLAALVLLSSGSFAQKKTVSKARNLALMEENPDFAGARQLIKEALENDETKDLAETWYVAGLIGYRQNYMERINASISHTPMDVVKMGESVMESLTYWKKADELAMQPQKDKKGNVIVDKKGNHKYDLKTRKNIADKVLEYYTGQELIYYGSQMNDDHNYEDAYRYFTEFLNIPALPMMQDAKYQEKMVKDSTYYLYKYYAARFAYSAEMYDDAIAIFRELSTGNVEASSSAQYLYQCYIDKKDSVTANNILDECIKRFPNDEWFLQNRINNLVQAGDKDAALRYLDQAIAMAPQGQYYNSKGSILSLQGRFEEAFAVFEKALSMEPENALFLSSYGFAYIDKGNQLNDAATYMDAKEYKKAKVEIDATFAKALPYFEKAYQLAPENEEYKRNLRQLYYRLGMKDKYDALAAE